MLLSFEKTKKILSRYKVPLVKSFLAKNQAEAIKYAKLIGYPVVLKIVSPQILHKTEMGGIKTDVKNEKELIRSFFEILKSLKKNSPRAKIEGILIQKQIKGEQIIVGAKKDPIFGPIVMFGLGGIFVEIFKDVSFKLAPISQKEAREMIKSIKGFKILNGFRGGKKSNLIEIEKFLANVSELISKENIKEIDFNPIIVNEQKALACDVKIIL